MRVPLACPLDHLALTPEGKTWRCAQGHSYDQARNGHLHLLPVQFKASKAPGDTADMVAARSAFLERGYYRPLLQSLISTLPEQQQFTVVDAGCGDGWWLNGLCAALESQGKSWAAAGVDISRAAIRAATRRSKRIQWVLGSNAHLPLQSASVDVLLCCFGFPHWPEFARVLVPTGRVVLLDPDAQHLQELRAQIYHTVQRHPPPSIEAAFQAGFTLRAQHSVDFLMEHLDQPALQALLAMTPHGHRAPRAGLAALAALPQLSVRASCCLRLVQLGPGRLQAPNCAGQAHSGLG